MNRFIFLFLLLATRAFATTYYVDMVSGSDAANGTTTGTPWKHVPGQTTATGTPLATTLVAGDVIAFKRGTVHTLDSSIIIKNSGGVGNPIIYDGALWGTGADAIIDGGYTVQYGFRDNSAVRSDITFRNMEVRNLGGWADDDPILSGALVSSIDLGTDVITTSAAHGLTVGTLVQVTYDNWAANFQTGGKTANALYYVIETAAANTLKVSATLGGTSVDFTSTLPGVLRIFRPVTSVTAPGGIAFDLQFKGDNILIENIYAHRIGTWRNTAPLSGVQSVSGTVVALENNNGVTIRDCVFERVRVGVSIKSTLSNGPIENVLVENCVIDHTVWGIDAAPRSHQAGLYNINVKGCTIKGQAPYDSGNWQGFGEKPHTDGIFIRNTSSMAGVWDIVVDGCLFYEDNPAASNGGTCDIFLDFGASARIQNCIFLTSPRATGAVVFGKTDAQVSSINESVEIYNCTFVTSGKCIAVAWTTGTTPTVFKAKNNVVWRNMDMVNLVAFNSYPLKATTTFDIDRNIYWASTADPATTNIFTIDNTGGYQTFAQWRAAYPAVDINSSLANPLLTRIVGSPSTWDVYPLPGSPAIGGGENLSAIFTTDFAGNTRPASGAWDIGAFDTATPPVADVTAPTILTSVINPTGDGLTVEFDEPVTSVTASHYAIASHTLSSATGSGTTWTMTISPVVQSGAVKTLGYTSGAGRTTDIAGNLLATFSGAAITNNSNEPTPDPPKAPRRGRGAGQNRAGR